MKTLTVLHNKFARLSLKNALEHAEILFVWSFDALTFQLELRKIKFELIKVEKKKISYKSC
jgi:hypothetical protein